MLLDKIKKYCNPQYDLNCAETMLYAANEEYGLNLSKEAFKTMAAFGGGMAIEETCGVISGAIAVLGIMFIVDRAHESDRVKNLTKEYIEAFKIKLGTENCKELKEAYRNDEVKCRKIIEEGAVILENIILRELHK